MKRIKIFTLILITVCLCAFLFSCNKDAPCDHKYDNECDSECNICSEKRAVLSHIWHSVDQELCQYKQTCAWCGLTMGENVEHNYIDGNGNTLDECISCGSPNQITEQEALEIAKDHFYYNYAEDSVEFLYSEGMGTHDDGNWEIFFKKLYTNGTTGNTFYYTVDKTTGEILSMSIEDGSSKDESISISRFMYTFAYWHIYDTLTGESYATLLCDDSYIDIDIEEPLDITAGDMLIVEHTGYFMTEETYPGSTGLYDGEVVSYRFEYSPVYTLFGEEVDSEAIRNQYDFRWGDYYVILNREGDFVSLDEYDGDILYLVLDKERAEKIDKNEIQPSWDETKIPIACALAYNPRDLEDDGLTNNPTIPPEDIRTVEWQFNYYYGDDFVSTIGNPNASLLINHGRLGKGFEKVAIPDDIVAGDTITIEYTGKIEILESYPSVINLIDGEVISYSFEYASVTKDVLTVSTVDRIMAEYDIKDEYIIINRNGEYKSLEDCMGKYIYLVTDQQRVKEQPDAEKHPIASICIFNPRDLKNGLSPVGPRNEKVSFDLDYHLLGDELEKEEDYKEDPTKFDFGYVCKDENGNEFIAYAPNLYSYTVLIECTEDKNTVYDRIRSVLDQFDPWYSTDRRDIDIDAQDLPNDMILITFPDFDTYFTCQDELLDKLSVLDCVKKIHVSYISSQNGTYSPKNPYEVYADVGSKYHKNDVFTTYEEYINALGTCIENSVGLQKITESTFESNYVFVVTNWHWRELEISDARLVGDTVYFTNNAYQAKGQLHDMIAYENSCVIVVPKGEIGELPENVTVKTVNVPIYIDGLANLSKIDEGDAITIAFAHFYANYNPIPEEGFAYVAQSIDGENDNYWYILIHKEYVGDTDEYDYVVKGGGFLYTISKNSGEIICIESGE